VVVSPSQLSFRRWASGLFDQQMWCFGRDIRREGGNVLLDLGMCRYRAPDPNKGSSLYTAPVEPGGAIFLWGFGAMYTEPGLGGVFVRRYDFAPKLTLRETGLGVHQTEQLGRLVNPSTRQELVLLRKLLPALVGWFAKYEHWVGEHFGTAYREACLASRDKPASVPAQAMARSWENAAKKSKRFRCEAAVKTGPWAGLLGGLRAAGTTSARLAPAYRAPIRVTVGSQR